MNTLIPFIKKNVCSTFLDNSYGDLKTPIYSDCWASYRPENYSEYMIYFYYN